MKKNERGFTLPELLMVVIIPLMICIKLAVVWFVLSLITSGLKAATHNCGQTWGIEVVVPGNWFCPQK